MINKDGRISPVISIAVLVLFSIALDVAMFVGMLYLFEAQSVESEEEMTRERRIQGIILRQTDTMIENQDRQIGLLIQQQERGNIFRNQSQQFQEGILTRINDTVSKVLERDANLTAEETREVVDRIRIVFNTTIPELNTQLENLTDKIDQIVEKQRTGANKTLQQDNNDKITQALELLQNFTAPPGQVASRGNISNG